MRFSPPPHPASLSAQALKPQCKTQRLRRSGPGGQHRNKVETAVVVTHTPTGVAAEANERRSQATNLEVAMFRLRVNLALAVRVEETTGYPSETWRGRVRAGRLAINPTHDDFPSLLAEALDMLSAHNWDDRAAADALAISRTQLVKFLKLEPAALTLLNQERESRGQAPLK